MRNEKRTWADGLRYLLQWDVNGIITTSNGPQRSRIRGEAILLVRGTHEVHRGLVVEQFGLAASGVEARKGHTGTITVRGLSSSGVVTPGRRTDAFRIEIACNINYESLDRARGRPVDKGCYYQPATEPAAAVLEATASTSHGRVRLLNGRVHVSCAAGEFEEVVAITVPLERATLIPLPATDLHYRFDKAGLWSPSADANIDANVCVASIRRQLVVQPVAFRNGATDPSPSGGTAGAQLATAQAVWGKACVDLVIRPTHFITDATLKTSSDLTAIRNSYTDSDPNAIEVFFVANALTAVGGGSAGAIGAASCKPVIAEPNSGNPVLVSHELGHVLNLLHPGPGSNSDPGTVMAPTGSAMAPGTQLVTHIMCTSVANPVLQTTTTACCYTHDIPNHYLRDFPTDVGNEPSEPIGVGMNRYAMSNVWNRLSNTPGVPSPATGPAHENPVRFNADMTPRTNYLFARVEQLVNLPVHSAVVRFFLKNPGSGGGAANLTFLGEVAVPGGLAVGVPQNVTLPWTVPVGVPNHSCIFAVVRSDAEPEGDQSTLDWWQFETLAYNDNDWAQRNLDIENVSSANTTDSNAWESGLFFIYLPPPRERPTRSLTLEVDARGARPLRALRLEFVGGRTVDLSPGRVQSIQLPIGNVRRPLVLVLHALVPGGLKTGTAMTVGINPSLGRRAFVGWAVQFRAGAPGEVMTQTLDSAAAGFGDLAELAHLPAVHDLFCHLGRGPCERPYSIEAACTGLVVARPVLKQAAVELARLAAARQTGAARAMTALLQALDSWDNGEAGPAAVIAAYRAASARAMATAALLAAKADK